MTDQEGPYLEGFATIPRSIQRDTSISWKAKMIYLTLSSRVNRRMQCWPSHALIAEESGLSEKTVRRALDELRSLGLVSWIPGRNKGEPNTYTLGPVAIDRVKEGRSEGPTPPLIDEEGRSEGPTGRSERPTGVGLRDRQTIQVNDARNDASKDTPPAALAALDLDAEFHQQFWPAYPRHVGVQAALVKYRAARKIASAETIMSALAVHCRAHANTEKQFIPHAATWLHQRRWEDRPDDINPAPVAQLPRHQRERDAQRAQWAEAYGDPWAEQESGR